MPVIDSYDKMKAYCFRALGEDGDQLLVVNVSDDQARDRIGDAVKTWQDTHMEGSTEAAIMTYIRNSDLRNGYIEIENMNAIKEIMTPSDSTKSNVEIMDDLDYIFHLEYADSMRHMGGGEGSLTNYHINMEYLATMRYMLTPDRLFTFNASTNRLVLQGKYPLSIGGELLDEFRNLGWDTGANTVLDIDAEATPDDQLMATRIRTTSTTPIQCSYTSPTTYYPKGLRTFMVSLKTGTYTGKVILSVKDRAGTVVATKTVQPVSYYKQFEIEAHYKEGHINDYVFSLESAENGNSNYFVAAYPSGVQNNFIFAVGYKMADLDEEVNSWDSGWLKAMCIALMKKQWAMNLKKFDGVQMAGGVTLNAQNMYNEAMADIQSLNDELASKWQNPPMMMIG